MERTFEAVLVEQCAPTLAGIKPANLFRYQAQERSEVYDAVAYWDRKLRSSGITLRIVKDRGRAGSFLIYAYRRKWLSQILSAGENLRFLRKIGYAPRGGCESFLIQLSERLNAEKGFPHEIGLFLGYPLADVLGFIANKGQNYTCSGCWKSYGDTAEAERTFDELRKCTDAYTRMYAQGMPVDRLAVKI